MQRSMSHVLKVSLQTTIYSLAQRGWSRRRIAKELGINRETVGRYLRLPKPAISITGDLVAKEESKPAISIAGTGAGRRSRCESFAELIAAKVEVCLSAQRIYQDLVEERLTRSRLTSAGITGSTLCLAGPLSHSIKAKWNAGLLTCGPTH